METIAIIQARMTSTRLPGKILKDFSNGVNMLDLQLQALQKTIPLSHIYIATTTNPEDDPVYERYHQICNVYRGDEADVLSRFLDITRSSRADHVIRVSSDNPFILPEGIRYLVEDHIKKNADYTTFTIEELPSMLVPNGFYVEVISAKALLDIETKANEREKEHVTYALYTRLKSDYQINLIDVNELNPILNNKHFRFSVDTPEDFEFIDQLIQALDIGHEIDMTVIENVIAYVDQHHLLTQMQQESNKKKNVKSAYTKD